MRHHLNFLDTTVRFDVDDAAQAAFEPVRRFFRHLLSPTAHRPPAFRIAVHPYDPDRDVDAQVWRIPRSTIRRSSAPEFTFDAHRVDTGTRTLYVNRATLLDAPADTAHDTAFLLRVTAGSTVQVIDFVRDLVIRRQEQLGTVVLHASGVARGEEAVAVAGPKGAGKTTTLLSVLRHGGWRYFTGDKLFCTLDGEQVLVHPWRDCPYVGVGTIRSDERLARLVRDSTRSDPGRLDPSHKILLDPDRFEEWLGSPFDPRPRRLATVLLPQVRPGEPLAVRRLEDDNERWAHLNKIVDRQADTTFFTWQSYLVPDYSAFYRSLSRLRAALRPVDMIRLTGTLDVDLDDVLVRARATAAAAGMCP
ncbi:hypothetical protein ABZ484_37470 [Streptomyces sp. NPDC006393]|uniref:hypothetical protein n=1 Tax=Streptomyces sp. NPDC006393 TaxID=3156763 RepID=UPI0033FB3C8C